MPLVAYYRVSTDRQGRSGLGLEAQQAAVREYGSRVADAIAAEYTEVESGRSRRRPVLAQAVALARSSGSRLVVAKLDRLARDAAFLLALLDSGVSVVFLDLPELSAGDPIMSRLVLTVLAAIAEFEGRRIGQRVKEALARYKARGGKLGAADPRCPGRRIATPDQQREYARLATEGRRRKAAEFRAAVRPVAEELRRTRSLSGVAAEMNLLGYRSRRGKAWTAGLVDSLLRG